MVDWIKKYLEKEEEKTLHCEYTTKNKDTVYVTVTIYSQSKCPAYSIEVNTSDENSADKKPAPPNIRTYINDNIEQLLDEAVVLIYHAMNKTSYIVEDSTGIYNTDIKALYGKLLVTGLEYDYAQIYNKTVSSLPGPKRYCNSNIFFTRITKKEKRYSLQEAISYLKLNKYEFGLKERSIEEVSDPIISITAPDITRKFGNNNKETFDFVTVELLLRRNLGIQDMEAYVKENLELFNKRVLGKIAMNKKYQSYGVPVEYLKLYSIGTHMKTGVRMMYELKR